jgi:hypothetical protein
MTPKFRHLLHSAPGMYLVLTGDLTIDVESDACQCAVLVVALHRSIRQRVPV